MSDTPFGPMFLPLEASSATDEAIERAQAIAEATGCYCCSSWEAGLRNLLAYSEGRRALLDVLQPTPEELGMELARYGDGFPVQHLGGSVWRFPTSERDEQ